MREPFTVGNFVHVIKRGGRGLSIVRDDGDRWRFLLMLFHFNDVFCMPENWYRELMDHSMANTFLRLENWPERRPIVKVLSFCLLDNHFHLLLKEVTDGGIAKFMQKLGSGMSNHFNAKYKERGSLFQGSYKSKTVEDDAYLRRVTSYIQVKNSFDLYSGGYEKACSEFDKAYEWAGSYPYCSLGDYTGVKKSPIIDREIIDEIFDGPNDFKSFSRDFIEGRNWNYEDDFELDNLKIRRTLSPTDFPLNKNYEMARKNL